MVPSCFAGSPALRCNFTRAFTSILRKFWFLPIMVMIGGSALPGVAQSTPDALQFFRNYFVTGDYVVAGKGFRGQGDATGFATNTITISNIPNDAVVVGAFLYWEEVESTSTPSSGNAFFQGYSIVGKSIGAQTPPCWSSGGGTGTSMGSKSLRVYRADVKPFLVVNGGYTANGTFQVRMRDSGSSGNTTPIAEGASLVVVYQTAHAPLKAVVLYDGAYSLNNGTAAMNLDIKGFYQAKATAGSPDGRLTHIVGDGQPKFDEGLYFNDGFVAENPFVGAQGFSWDNPTFNVNVPDDADHVSTQVLPISSSFDCLSWGAVVFSTPVKDQDNDGLLDRWETEHGYTDLQDGSFVSLPGSHVDTKDIYVQLDFLKKSGGGAHSHLLKLDAINSVGQAFARQNISLHVDAGNRYPASAFVIGSGRGGNAIDEDSIACADTAQRLCQFPSAAGIVSWKGGVHAIKNQFFQHGRKDSYRYLLSGHSVGFATFAWSVSAKTLVNISCCQASGGQQLATLTTSAAHGLQPNARVTVAGAISDWELNGTYLVRSVPSSTTFTIAVTNVTSGVYGGFSNQALGVSGNQYNEPNLAVYTGSVTSMSGVADLPGGDILVALGLWRADDPAGCQADPSVPLGANQSYCNDQVGTALVQGGTWMHELGHTLMLLHGGYYPGAGGGPVTFGQNCKPNHVTSMSYLFQIRGIPGGTVDYSGQVLPTLNEDTLTESLGLGHDLQTSQLPAYGTRWYAPPGFLDNLVQNQAGGRFAKKHCDGSTTDPNELMVRVQGASVINGQVAPIDWNNNGALNDVVHSQDMNFSGTTNDSDMQGFNDWAAIDLRHIGGRRNVAGFSVDTSSSDVLDGGSVILGGGSVILGGGDNVSSGADVFSDGGGSVILGGGSVILGGGSVILGGGSVILGGGAELTFEQANATVEAPTNLAATTSAQNIVLTWNPPGFGQIRTYYIWRADVTKAPMSTSNPPQNIGKVTGTPPVPTFTDNTVKSNVTYLYFVTAALGADSGVNNGNQSGPSEPVTISGK